jgi:hypothetical protein
MRPVPRCERHQHETRRPPACDRVVFGSRRRRAAPLARRCGVRRPRPSA